MKTEWQQESRIRSYEAGPDGKARIAPICNLLQECASTHADHLGIGVELLRQHGMIWALARIGVEILRRPNAGEPVVVQTWLRGIKGPFAMREFAVLDASSVTIARASYGWLAIDVGSKRLIRPAELLKELPLMPDRVSLDADLGKIAEPGKPIEGSPIHVRPSDMDIQKHVNNTRYIAWIEDALDRKLQDRYISWLQVNFLSEASAGELIDVRVGAAPRETSGDTSIVVLSRGGTELVRSLAVTKRNEEIASELAESHTDKQITEETLAAAGKISGISLTPEERNMALEAVSSVVETYAKRRSVELPNSLAPAELFVPMSSRDRSPQTGKPDFCYPEAPPLPKDDTDIAYAPLTHLSAWLRNRSLTSTRLCRIYLDRLDRYGDELCCVVTLMKSEALRQAARADDEIGKGKYRGPLHGIPWGAKDLLDTKGIPTTWGATPYKNRVPNEDAAVVRLLEEAGAVLLGKLTLGALAYGDIWFGGKTKNPWNTEQGSSGSSAGSSAAVAAGLAGFCIGSETMGSIVSPSLRCGATGLRPSFGRVPRNGAMALSWSYDKLGPICRYAGDTAVVLETISARDRADPCSADLPFAMAAGVELIEIELPDLPYDSLGYLITVDAAAAFEELTRSDADDDLVWQDKEAWPNSFRAAHFFPAIEYVQLQRFRRLVMVHMERLFSTIDAAISPEHRSKLLLVTNSTGQPPMTIRAGFNEDNTPFGINLWGRYLGEDVLCRLGMHLEQSFGVADRRPPKFV